MGPKWPSENLSGPPKAAIWVPKAVERSRSECIFYCWATRQKQRETISYSTFSKINPMASNMDFGGLQKCHSMLLPVSKSLRAVHSVFFLEGFPVPCSENNIFYDSRDDSNCLPFTLLFNTLVIESSTWATTLGSVSSWRKKQPSVRRRHVHQGIWESDFSA